MRDAAQLLGGDAVVLADKPLAPAFTQEALRRGFVVGQAANFPSMARAGAGAGRRGQARGGQGGRRRATRCAARSTCSFGEAAPVQSLQRRRRPPAPSGSIPALANALSLKVGDGLELGDATLRIAGADRASSPIAAPASPRSRRA